MVAESAKPGRTVSEVARRFGIAPSQLFAWRRQLLEAPLPSAVLSGPSATPGEAERIEIVLPSGVVIRVDDRHVISGIVCVLKLGCRWVDAPAINGPRKTLDNRFARVIGHLRKLGF